MKKADGDEFTFATHWEWSAGHDERQRSGIQLTLEDRSLPAPLGQFGQIGSQAFEAVGDDVYFPRVAFCGRPT